MLNNIDTKTNYKLHFDFMSHVVKQLDIKEMAEIGVLHGAFSNTILSKCDNINKYYLIDSWKVFMDPPVYTQAEWDKRYNNVVTLMKQYGDRAEIIRLNSIEGSKKFEDESLDMVYLDANHSFKHVDADIKAWWPKIRKNGYLAGHDLTTVWPGVREAVVSNFGMKYYSGLSSSNGKTSTWDGVWIVSKEEHENIHNVI